MENTFLQKNIKVGTLLELADPRAEITIWINEDKQPTFKGFVYQLLNDKLHWNGFYIVKLNMNPFTGFEVAVTEKWNG